MSTKTARILKRSLLHHKIPSLRLFGKLPYTYYGSATTKGAATLTVKALRERGWYVRLYPTRRSRMPWPVEYASAMFAVPHVLLPSKVKYRIEWDIYTRAAKV